ncbi:MAG: 6-phosphogluconate dehydrogenase [Actinomycetota bacterium]|jgi:6-phosphogluconate dehydrogenase|nr:6-phosphogluconate dehydrogenase [Actinomycetota bacterium]
MRIGMVGLGRMGANMTTRLLRGGHEVIAYDVDKAAVKKAAAGGAEAVDSLETLEEKLSAPRAVWVMVPSGDITEMTIDSLADLLDKGDTVIDGGNSRYTDTIRRAELLATKGITLLDSGTSGGIWGLDEGFCLMVGGDKAAFEHVEPILKTLAPENGYAHVGSSGAGHFTKMVHNGIEYALMQAYGEGFELLHESEFDIDTAQVAELWRHGSVVRSWLLDLTARALDGDHDLQEVAPYIDDSGEGRWTLGYAIDHAVPVPTIATALFARFASRQDASFAGKVIAALRKEFGGHATRKPSGE